MTKHALRLVPVVALLALAGCGSDAKPAPSTRAATEFDYAVQTEAFIRSDGFSEQAGIEFDKPACETPFRAKVGETYSCTAVDRGGAGWVFTVEITEHDGFTVTGAQSDDGRKLTATG